jgi:cysteine sulfinate desulfinase/cysteine desulfurase-like protein
MIGGGQARLPAFRQSPDRRYQCGRPVSATWSLDAVRSLRDCLESTILSTIPNARLNGTSDPNLRLPNTSSISFENTNGEMILARLDDLGICVSTGSACNSADHSASPVLQAMNIPYSTAMGSIRFSLGRFNTEDEVDRVLEALPGITINWCLIQNFDHKITQINAVGRIGSGSICVYLWLRF